MVDRSTLVWLSDIRDEIAGVHDLTTNVDMATFAASWPMKRAVEHALLIIAEASKHLPASLKDRYQDVPWHQIHGLGNMLRHEYRRIDPAILWSVVVDHLDRLDDAVKDMIGPT